VEILVFMLLLFGGVIAYLGWEWWSQRAFVRCTLSAWRRQREQIDFAPVGAACYATWPQRRNIYANYAVGALGLADAQLIFTGMRKSTHDIRIPYDDIRWVGFRDVRVPSGRRTVTRRALVVHCLRHNAWRVLVYLTDGPKQYFSTPPDALAAALSAHTGLPLRDESLAREDFGPMPATTLHQDVHGQWHQQRDIELYLAPDRLLVGGGEALPLAQITAVAAYTKGLASELYPFSENLLRVEYQDGEGQPDVAGFLVRDADRWAETIHEKTGVPLDLRAGRKQQLG
jgi:hypothetical protein